MHRRDNFLVLPSPPNTGRPHTPSCSCRAFPGREQRELVGEEGITTGLFGKRKGREGGGWGKRRGRLCFSTDVWTKAWSNCRARSLGCLLLLYLYPTNQRSSLTTSPPRLPLLPLFPWAAWLYWEQQIKEPSIWVWSPITEGSCQHALRPVRKAGVLGRIFMNREGVKKQENDWIKKLSQNWTLKHFLFWCLKTHTASLHVSGKQSPLIICRLAAPNKIALFQRRGWLSFFSAICKRYKHGKNSMHAFGRPPFVTAHWHRPWFPVTLLLRPAFSQHNRAVINFLLHRNAERLKLPPFPPLVPPCVPLFSPLAGLPGP